MDGWMDGWTDGWTDGRMDGRMDGRTDGWMGRRKRLVFVITIRLDSKLKLAALPIKL